MYANATQDTYLQGTLVMTENELLDTIDSSGALMRRIRPFKISQVPKEKHNLLSKGHGGVGLDQ